MPVDRLLMIDMSVQKSCAMRFDKIFYSVESGPDRCAYLCVADVESSPQGRFRQDPFEEQGAARPAAGKIFDAEPKSETSGEIPKIGKVL